MERDCANADAVSPEAIVERSMRFVFIALGPLVEDQQQNRLVILKDHHTPTDNKCIIGFA
jgi:hypothetical protein